MSELIKKLIITVIGAATLTVAAYGEDQTNLEISHRVLGVIVSAQPEKSLALIKNQNSKSVAAFHVGDKLDATTSISKIQRKQIEIIVSGKNYILAVGAQVAVSKTNDDPNTVSYSTDEIERNGDTVRLTSKFKDHLIKEKLGEVMMQAATEVAMVDGHIIGFRLFEITPNSVYEKAGFKNGDIITHINGLEINDAGVAIRTLNQLKGADEADVRYIRQGSNKNMKIQTH